MRLFYRRSRKSIRTTRILFCLLGICIIYLADIKVITSRFTDIKFSKLTQEETFLDKKLTHNINSMSIREETRHRTVNTSTYLNTTIWGYLQRQQYGDVDGEGHSFKNIFKNMTSLKNLKTNNSSITGTPEKFPTTTTMTFNTAQVVHCKESPYIECFPPNVKPSRGKIFKIAYLRRPFWISKSELDMSSCKFSQCTFNETTVTNDTDIVVIYGIDLKKDYQVSPRWSHQLYAVQAWEPPCYTFSHYIKHGKSPWNNQFNIIMSHRLDSDFFIPYHKLKFNPKPLDQRPNYYEIAQTKTRTAVWIVSHCETLSKREKYVKEMQKYIDVDIFGRCGTKCSDTGRTCNDWPSTYKFYLSFENSLCTDYVTEKFFKLFDPRIHVVPVVRGGADYDKHIPNFTYINSAHFKTPKDLALHLKHLASDLQTYSQYLEYKDLYTLIPDSGIDIMMGCKICTFLHTQKLPETTRIYNITKYFADGQCHIPTDF